MACSGSGEPLVYDDGASDSFLGAEGKADAFGIAEGSPTAGAILQLVNETESWYLESTVKVGSGTVAEIEKARLGADGQIGTPDDVVIASLAELDAVPYVGPKTFKALVDFVVETQMVAPYTDECGADRACAGEQVCTAETFNYSAVQVCAPADPALDSRAAVVAFGDALAASDTAALESFVHPTMGFFVLSSPGVMAVALPYSRYADAAQVLTGMDFYCPESVMTRGSLPNYLCGQAGSGWAKEGCYLNDRLVPAQLLSSAGNFSPEFGDDYQVALERARAMESVIRVGAYSTLSLLGLYFFEDQGRWYLGVVDVRTWCEA